MSFEIERSMPRKILIAGTFCAGKTTLLSDLSKSLDAAQIIPDVARDILAINPGIDWSIPELRSHLLIQQLLWEARADKSNAKHILVDAGVVANLAHDRLYGIELRNSNYLIKSLKHSKYDLVFFCGHQTIELEDDGERNTSEKDRSRLANETLHVLDLLGYTDIITLHGNQVERVAMAISVIHNRECQGTNNHTNRLF